ncbi:MAG: hypothetical protein AB2L14_05025 [Candidatus Xenobiia bacterium LiM19]
MRIRTRLLILFSLLLFFTSIFMPAYADIRLNKPFLTSKKINLKRFTMLGLSGDGKIMTAQEKVSDLKLIQKGLVYKFWIIEFQGEDREHVKFSEILLPITEFQQTKISSDGKLVLITGNKGTKFLLIDVPTKKLTVLFEHKTGQPGFKSEVGLVSWFVDKFCIWGYFYNSKSEMTSYGMATVDLSKQGVSIFSLAQSTTEFEKQYRAWYTEWVSPTQCYFIYKKKGTKIDRICFFDKGTVKELDQTSHTVSEASAANRIVYCATREGKKVETLVKDAVQGKTWILSKENKPYTYMFVAREKGDTVIVSYVDIKKNSMSCFYAREQEDFKLKPIAALQNKPMCMLRLAAYGNVYATFDGNEINWAKIEQK